MKPNFTYKKSTITFFSLATFLVLLFSTTVGYSQTIEIMNPNVTYSSIGNTTSCNSNEVIIEKVFLGDVSGNPITNCPVTGDVFIYIKLSKTATKYALYTEFKLFIDGIQYKIDGTTVTNEFIQVKQALSTANGTNQLSTTTNYQVAKIPYNCGASFELKDIYVSWGPNASTKPDDDQDGPKCDSGVPNITVDGPLEVDFTSTRDCNAITVTSDVTGGKIYQSGGLTAIQTPYKLKINYGDGTGDITITPNPDLYNDTNQEFIDYVFSAHSYPVNNTAIPIVYTITLTATDTATPSAASKTKTHTVTIYPQLAGLTLTPSQTSCNGSTGSITTSGATGGNGSYTYDLLYASTSTGSYSAAGQPTNGDISGNYTGLGTGFYKVTVKDTNGCSFTSNFAQIIVATPPTVTKTQTNVLCYGASTGAINITVAGGVAPYTYAWTGTGVSASSEDQTGLAAGDYIVTVTDANGCTATTSVTIDAAPAQITLTATPSQIVCFGGKASVTLSSNGVAPFTYGGDA
ncbi:hypothetical protein FQU23_005265, partial [Flavobacterium sp. XN-5]|uniref:SprB repeat-containing protein n=1 Tax=Flavobacterium sp. XN-5 TaxID=2599390 RepID=UPI0013F6B631|nr:hypothetical protein [Flavobacterium sp. XN-5]